MAYPKYLDYRLEFAQMYGKLIVSGNELGYNYGNSIMGGCLMVRPYIPLHPYVYYATRYPFHLGQANGPRICYTSSIYLIEQGKGVLRMNNTSYPMKSGVLVYIPAGKSHRWEADSTDSMVHICCYFDWRFVDRPGFSPIAAPICYDFTQLREEYVGPFSSLDILEITRVDKTHAWVQLFERFYKSNELSPNTNFRRNLKIQGHFQLFLAHFLEHTLASHHRTDPRIYDLVERLEHDMLNGNVKPIETYREELQLSSSYFHEIFKRATGFTPKQYVHYFRISQIKSDLLQTDLTVTEIAEKHHFSSIHYLSRLFQKITGVTPTEFRSQHPFKRESR